MQQLLSKRVATVADDRSIKDSNDLLARLRDNGLLAFGEVIFDIQPDEFKEIKQLLPRMASDEVQRNWTGNCGLPLLMQSIDFVRTVSTAYSTLTKNNVRDAKILDFGCGYGRIARLMYFFAEPTNVFGADPWDESIKICKSCGLGDNFKQSDYVPTALPFGINFDFIYAFSVFTHLSEKTTRKCLSTLRKYVSTTGMLCITIRPIEYWSHHQPQDGRVADMISAHNDIGFAFQPHVREPLDGEITYGDTSMTPEWLTKNCPEWRVAGLDTSYFDQNQLYLYLMPA